jgi:hypothetical protein
MPEMKQLKELTLPVWQPGKRAGGLAVKNGM